MLQIKIKTLMASTLAIAALAIPATAQSCDLSDGFAKNALAFAEEADACLEGVIGIDYDRVLEKQIFAATNLQRVKSGAEEVVYMDSLQQAAYLHAMDMAARNYAAHDDLEGRSHMDRVRLLDRTILIGASGANVAVLNGNATAEDILKAINADKANRANTQHDGFSHLGIGVAKANGKTYVVQLFAAVDGRLSTPLPLVVTSESDLTASFTDARLQPVGWRLETADGQTIDRGYGSVISPKLAAGQEAYLTVDVSYRTNEYALRGPMIVAN